MRKNNFSTIALSALLMLATVSCGANGSNKTSQKDNASSTEVCDSSIVYMTTEITPESLVKIYEALGKEAKGRVAVKISTGESEET